MKAVILCLSLVVAAGCVQNQRITRVQSYDYDLSCDELKREIIAMEGKKDELEDESGVTGKNVGSAVLFWPGVIVNELTASKNVDSAQNRLEHLNRLYAEECRTKRSEKE